MVVPAAVFSVERSIVVEAAVEREQVVANVQVAELQLRIAPQLRIALRVIRITGFSPKGRYDLVESVLNPSHVDPCSHSDVACRETMQPPPKEIGSDRECYWLLLAKR